ncbi:MAG: ATP-dependent helicase [Methylococcaceae bacterium]|nr:ATP-dependent helicase [Methylococcaceae bacterium]
MKTKLLEKFHALPEEEQTIVLTLAIVFAPIGQTNLQKLLRTTGIVNNATIKELSTPEFKAKLKKTGLVLFTPEGLLCEKVVSEDLMKLAVKKEDFFKKVASEIIHNPTTFVYRTALANTVKQLRLHLYQNRVDEFVSVLGSIQAEFSEHVNYVFDRLFFDEFDDDWFSSLHEGIRFAVLKYHLYLYAAKLEACLFQQQLFDKYFSDLAKQPPYIALSYIELKLHRGLVEKGMEDYLQEHLSIFSLKLLGTLCFLENRNDEAITYYGQSLGLIKKETRKRNVVISGLDGQFYYFALLKARTADSLKTLKNQLEISLKIESNKFTYPNQRLLEGIAVYQSQKNADECRYLFYSPYIKPKEYGFPYDSLFHSLLLYWLDETERVTDQRECRVQDDLIHFCRQAHEAGYLWYAAVSASLLVKLKCKDKDCLEIAKYYKNFPFVGMVDLLPRIEQWERALTALTLLSETKGDGASPAQEMRMIWQLSLDKNSVRLTPREQKIGKTGRWTKGRAVALSRLEDDVDDFDYLSQQDKKICKQITSHYEDYYYGYRPKEVYYLGGKGLLAAVGHPYVYFESDEKMSAPIEVTKAEPQLLVKEKGKNLHISLVPEIEDEVDVIVERSATGVLVYEITEQHQEVAQILTPKGLTVPSKARQQVIDSIASIASTLTVQSDIGGQSTHAETVKVDSRLHIHLQPVVDGLQIEVFVQPFQDGGPVYKPETGGTTVLAEIDGKQLQTARNFKTEKKYVKQLLENCPELYSSKSLNWTLDDPEMALEALLQLQQIGDFAVLEWPKGKRIKIHPEIDLSEVRFSVRKEKDWFAVEGELAINEDEVLQMQKLINLLNASKGRFLEMEDGQFVALTKELRQRLDDLSGLGDIHGDKVRFHPLAASALDEITDGMDIKATKAWKDQLKRLNNVADLKIELPSTLQGELRDYQVEGYQWMKRLAHWGAGACLADDMGLGKTIQALALILSRAKDGATLILAPTSVCINWLEEAERFAPTLNVQQYGIGDRQKMLDEAGAFDLIVCSYGLLQTQGDKLAEKKWQTVVADEAQAIKNMQTKRSKAAMALQADFKLITTGTPIENHLGELWNLFNFINPGLLGSIKRFNEQYAGAIENTHDYGTQQRLKKLLRPFILRRLKSDVLTELPPKTEITLHVELSDEEKAMYEALRRNAMKTMDQLKAQEASQGQQQLKVLAEIMKLRRACCHPSLVIEDSPIASSKLAAFEELVDELIANRHKALVFSQFIGHLDILRNLLDEKEIHYQYLDGSTPVKKRKEAMNAFQAGEGDLFLISLKAGGSGLNLTAADYVIHMDPWWNPAVEDQASDRAHRMGQKRPVTIYRLVAKDTIEDKIVELHKHKRDLANNLLEGGEVSGKMSIEEIVGLIKDI